MLNEVDIDFRNPGLPHSVVKQADNYRVRELVKKIENHPHRQSLQRDLQQNNAYNPFSEKSKKMIKDMDNVELFELFETDLKRSAKSVCCIGVKASSTAPAGISWKKVKPTEALFNVHWTFSQFQVMSLRRGDLMAIDMGKLQNKEIIILPIIWERDASRGIFKGSIIVLWTILNFRASQLEHDRDEEVCIKMDELAQKDFSRHMTQAEYFRYRRNWWISLNNSRTSGPLKNRSDFNEALSTLHHLTPRIWRTTTQASAILEVSILAPIIEFFLQLVAMERFLVELILIQIKVHTWAYVQSDMDQTSDVRLSRFSTWFCCSWIVYSWRQSAATDGWCKDNTSQDHFRSVNLYKEFAYRSEIELIGTATTIELLTRSA